MKNYRTQGSCGRRIFSWKGKANTKGKDKELCAAQQMSILLKKGGMGEDIGEGHGKREDLRSKTNNSSKGLRQMCPKRQN